MDNLQQTGSDIQGLSIVEANINDLRVALDQGWTSSVDLVARYLRRIALYDRRGKLNSIPVINRSVFQQAAASDDRRARGVPLGPLEGIPFTVKDSYKVKGMTMAAGSPAFKDLIASDDAFTVKLLQDAGAVLIGRTNMPPMAAGGMQRGVYGRAESPYNPEYLTAAFASGSSNGSATSTAASFAAFGMAEETVSSGRSPASNNGLVAYTPSRGLISIRGNWPLYPTCDVVVPHTRTMRDMFEILDIIVVKDECTNGDFWRHQPFISLPDPSEVRPSSFKSLADPNSLRGKRLGVPKMYIGNSEELNCTIETRQSIIDLWHKAKASLESLGATVIETSFPLISLHDTVSANFARPNQVAQDEDLTKSKASVDEGLTEAWNSMERRHLVAYAWDDFLIANNNPSCNTLATVDASHIFPRPPGALPDRYTQLSAPIPYSELVELITPNRPPITSLPGMQAALTALENRRKGDFEDWIEKQGFDALVFPANADVGPAAADKDAKAADNAWRNGVLYSNGNRILRHLGIPSITVPMGIMADTQMPVGLTFAGKAYSDAELLSFASAFESERQGRQAPRGTPEVDSDFIVKTTSKSTADGRPHVTIESHAFVAENGHTLLKLAGAVEASSGDDSDDGIDRMIVYVDGVPVKVCTQNDQWTAEAESLMSFMSLMSLTSPSPTAHHGEVAEIDRVMVVAVVYGKNGRVGAELKFL